MDKELKVANKKISKNFKGVIKSTKGLTEGLKDKLKIMKEIRQEQLQANAEFLKLVEETINRYEEIGKMTNKERGLVKEELAAQIGKKDYNALRKVKSIIMKNIVFKSDDMKIFDEKQKRIMKGIGQFKQQCGFAM